jgi:hypothetical protein
MADTRRLGSRRTRTNSTSIKGILCTLVLGSATLAYGYFLERPAPLGERADRIDFSSLATVVTIDEYVAGQVQGLRSEYKDDMLVLSNAAPPLAAANLVKVNFGGPVDPAAAKVSALVAGHSAKLQQHLDRGWKPTMAVRGDLASAVSAESRKRQEVQISPVRVSIKTVPTEPRTAATAGATADGKVGGTVSGSMSGGTGLGGRTGISGLSPSN